jgi:hypothetical protein
LSFDRYGASQVVQLAGVDDKSDQFAGLTIREQKRRVWVGRTADGNASVFLNGRRRPPSDQDAGHQGRYPESLIP